MESLLLIAALVISLLIALLALANKETVAINYLFGETKVSLIILILASACAGAVITGLLSLLRSARSALRFRELRRQLGEAKKRLFDLEQENSLLTEKIVEYQAPAETDSSGGRSPDPQPGSGDK